MSFLMHLRRFRQPGPGRRTRCLPLRLEPLEDRRLLSNGTAAGTALVKDINPGNARSDLSSLTNLNGILYFEGYDGTNPGLWKSDGTAAGTVLVKAINPGSPLTVVNRTLFFGADDGTTGTELWKSDGTTAGTVLVKDILPGIAGSGPRFLTNVNGSLFFNAYDRTHGEELWKSDGTAAGTVLVKDINPGSSGSFPYELTNVNGTLFFVASTGTGKGLWKSDGTAAGTVLVEQLNSGQGPLDLTSVNRTLFFRYDDGKNGLELWKSDGTAKGTMMVKDIFPGSTSVSGYKGTYHIPNSSDPDNLVNVNGTLFFSATDGAYGRELWKSDGTSKGTVLVSDIRPGAGSSSPSQSENVNGTLFFSANNGTTGQELWKSNGTVAGTVLVKDINPGSANSYPSNLANANGTLYFAANDGTHGRELWKSDGTTAGTILVADINPGSADSNPAYLTQAGGHLFFSADDGVHGAELWDPPILPAPGDDAPLDHFAAAAPSRTAIIDSASVLGPSPETRPAAGALLPILTPDTENGFGRALSLAEVSGAGDYNRPTEILDHVLGAIVTHPQKKISHFGWPPAPDWDAELAPDPTMTLFGTPLSTGTRGRE